MSKGPSLSGGEFELGCHNALTLLLGGLNGSADEEGGGGGGAWYDDDDPVMDEEEVDPDDIPETKPPPKRAADPPTAAPVKIEPPEKISDWAEEMEPVGASDISPSSF